VRGVDRIAFLYQSIINDIIEKSTNHKPQSLSPQLFIHDSFLFDIGVQRNDDAQRPQRSGRQRRKVDARIADLRVTIARLDIGRRLLVAVRHFNRLLRAYNTHTHHMSHFEIDVYTI
jgi:hypothetical protein